MDASAHSDRPISDRKLAANRANAQRSTGPRTAQGKARSRLNSLKHGQTAKLLSLIASTSGPERKLFMRLMAEMEQRYAADDPIARVLFERLAVNYLRLLRAYDVERHGFEVRAKLPSLFGSMLPGDAVQMTTYDAAAERSILRIVRELRRLGLIAQHAPQIESPDDPPDPAAPRVPQPSTQSEEGD